jgi:phage-related protein
LVTPIENVALKLRGFKTSLEAVVDYVKANQDFILPIVAGLTTFAGALVAIQQAQQGLVAAQGLKSLAASLGPLIAAAGPVGIVAAVIVAIGVAAFVAYQKFEPFRNAVDATARVIADVAIAAFNGFLGVMSALGGVVSTVGTAFSTAFNTVQTVVTTAAAAVIAALTPIVTWFADHLFPALAAIAVAFAESWRFAYERVAEAVGLIIQVVTPFALHLVDIIQIAFTIMSGIVSQATNAITTAITVMLSVLQPIWSTGWNVMLTVVTTIFNLVRNAVEVTLNTIRGIFSAITAAIRGDWSGFWSALVSIVSGIFGGAVAAVSSVLHGISGAVSNILGGIPGIISGIAGGVRSAVSGIASALASAVSTIEGYARRIRDAISSIPGAGVVGSLAGAIFGAEGGIVRRPTLMVVGEAGPEAVVPLGMFGAGGTLPPLKDSIATASIPVSSGGGMVGGPTINIYAPLGVDRNEVIASVQQGLRQYESARRGAF